VNKPILQYALTVTNATAAKKVNQIALVLLLTL
jgi:hypothetical protein